MPVTERKVGILDVGVFSLVYVPSGDTVEDYIGDLKTATLTMEVETEEGKAVDDRWAYPIATNCKWKIESDIFVNTTTTKDIFKRALSGNQMTVVFNTNGNYYSGKVLPTASSHKSSTGIQMFSLSLAGVDTLTWLTEAP